MQAFATFIKNNLDDAKGATIQCATPERVPEFLDSFGPPPPHTRTIRGRTVITRSKGTPEERERVRKAIAEIATKAAMRGKGAEK